MGHTRLGITSREALSLFTFVSFDCFHFQEILASEERKRIEMERLKEEAGESDNSPFSESPVLMKEPDDNTSALMKQYDHSMRSDSSRPQDVSTLEVQESPAVHVDPARDLNYVS